MGVINLKQEVMLEKLRNTFPRAKLVAMQARPTDKHQVMFAVPLVDNLQTIVETSRGIDPRLSQRPPMSEVAPLVWQVFPTEQPVMDDDQLLIENNIFGVYHPSLLHELGYAPFMLATEPRKLVMSMVAGHYQREDDERRLILDRYDQATHVILQVFWLDGYAPPQSGLECSFARRNRALEFYRVPAAPDYCGSDFWVAELKRDSIIYNLLAEVRKKADELIVRSESVLRAEAGLHDMIRQLFVKEGVTARVEALDGWIISFDPEAICLRCRDNVHYEASMNLEYSKEALEGVKLLLELYEDGELNLLELFLSGII